MNGLRVGDLVTVYGRSYLSHYWVSIEDGMIVKIDYDDEAWPYLVENQETEDQLWFRANDVTFISDEDEVPL